MPAVIDATKCNGCGLCDLACPGDVIHTHKDQRQAVVEYPEECWHCGACRLECRQEAIKIVFPLQML